MLHVFPKGCTRSGLYLAPELARGAVQVARCFGSEDHTAARSGRGRERNERFELTGAKITYYLSTVKFQPLVQMSDTYHHGDLRRALLDEAHAVVNERGVGALSLRDLARRVDVSPTAPYHHFKGKADLVCALAEDALDGLDAALADADAMHSEPAERIRAMGVAYIRYAVEHPEQFRLAFRPEMGDPFAGLAQEDGVLPDDIAGFRHLVRAVADLEPDPAECVKLAVSAWSLVHGLAALLVDGPLRALAADPDRVGALARDVTARFGFAERGG